MYHASEMHQPPFFARGGPNYNYRYETEAQMKKSEYRRGIQGSSILEEEFSVLEEELSLWEVVREVIPLCF